MKLLVLTTRLFDKPASGGEICTARLLRGLREAGHEIVLVGRGDASAAAGWAEQVESVGALEPPFDEQGVLRRAAAVAGALLAGAAITVHRHGGSRVAPAVAARQSACDAIVVDHLQTWPWLGRPTRQPVMLVQHNLESDNYRRRSIAPGHTTPGQLLTRLVMRREAERLELLERQALCTASVVACLSDDDAAHMIEPSRGVRAPAAARLVVLPGYPLALPGARPARPPGDGLPTIGLIGTWTWQPNREGLLWLLQQVWPALQGRARLVLAGNGLEGLPLPLDTQVLGRVPDVGVFLAAADLIAVPSLSGSGVQEKAIEAIATGLPVVATAHALRGLGPALPPNVHCASDASGFAAACQAALRERAVGEAGAWAAEVTRWSAQRREAYAAALEQGLQLLQAARGPAAAPFAGPRVRVTA